MIELGKKYQTKDGRDVEIYKIDGGGCYPVIGIIYLKLAELCECMRWTSDGKCAIDIQDNEDYENFNGDLVEIPNFKPSFILERYTKLFEYFGLPLSIPDEIQWLATDEDGTLYGYFTEPYCVNLDSLPDQGYWDQTYWDDDKEGVKIVKIQIIGDWKQSKLKVNSDK